jgi:hypothetical protein
VCGSVCFVLFCLVFNFLTRIPQFPSGSLCHEWGYGGTRRRLVLKSECEEKKLTKKLIMTLLTPSYVQVVRVLE